jgi:hypothetical protein
MKKSWELISEEFWSNIVEINTLPLSESVRESRLQNIEKFLFNVSLFINENELDDFFDYIEQNIILNEKVSDTIKKVGNKTIDVLDKVNQTKKKVVKSTVSGAMKYTKFMWDNFIPDSIKKMGKKVIENVKKLVMFLVKKASVLIKKAKDELIQITKKIIPKKYISECDSKLLDSLDIDDENIILESISINDIDKLFNGYDFDKIKNKFKDQYKLLSFLIAELKKKLEESNINADIDTETIANLIKFIKNKKISDLSEIKFKNLDELNYKLISNNVPYYLNFYYHQSNDVDIDKISDIDIDKVYNKIEKICNIDKKGYLIACKKENIDKLWTAMKIDKYMTFDEFLNALGNKKLYIVSSILSVGTSVGLAMASGGILPIVRLIGLLAFTISPLAIELYADVLEKRGQNEKAEFHRKLASAARGLATIVSIVRIVENIITFALGGVHHDVGNVATQHNNIKGQDDISAHDNIHNDINKHSNLVKDVDLNGHKFSYNVSSDSNGIEFKNVEVDGKDISDLINNGGYDKNLILSICSNNKEKDACMAIMLKIAKGVSADELNKEMQDYMKMVSDGIIQNIDNFINDYEKNLEMIKQKLDNYDGNPAFREDYISKYIRPLLDKIKEEAGISNISGEMRMGFPEHFVVDGKDIGELLNDLRNSGIINANYGSFIFNYINNNDVTNGLDDLPDPQDLKEYIKLTHLLSKYSDNKEELIKALYNHKNEFKDFINVEKVDELFKKIALKK